MCLVVLTHVSFFLAVLFPLCSVWGVVFVVWVCVPKQILEKWFAEIGTSAAGATKDLNLYLEQIGKIEQAEMVRESEGACVRSIAAQQQV